MEGTEHDCCVVSSTIRPRSVTGVLRAHAPALCDARPRAFTAYKSRVLRKLVACQQPELGAHAWHCKWCGNTKVSYNGCHNRHCTTCFGYDRAEWVGRVLSWSLPIDYLHGVFTLPHEFIPLILANERELYGCLFQAASRTLKGLAREHHGATLGYVMVLHSWGQRMNPHPHIHVLVTGGGLSQDESAWIPLTLADTVFDTSVLAERFRQEFLGGLRRLFRQAKLTMPREMADVVDEPSLDRWLAPVLGKQWRIDVQGAPPEYTGADAVVHYLAGYVVGTAIRDRRILRHDGRCVVIGIKNYRTGRREERRMSGEEFVKRFALHILPERMMRVRYAGLFYPERRQDRLAICRQLLGATDDLADDAIAEAATNRESDRLQRGDRCVSTPRYSPDCERCGLPTTWAGANRTAEAALALVAYVRYQLSLLGTRATVMREYTRLPCLAPLTLTCLPAVACDSATALAYCATVLIDLPRPET